MPHLASRDDSTSHAPGAEVPQGLGSFTNRGRPGKGPACCKTPPLLLLRLPRGQVLQFIPRSWSDLDIATRIEPQLDFRAAWLTGWTLNETGGGCGVDGGPISRRCGGGSRHG